jgi:hypothetical protein
MQMAPRRKRVFTFPEWRDDNNNVKPPDFAQPATRGGYRTQTAKDIMRPVQNAPPKLDYVPLKSAQTNSHAFGAALFNAPVAGDVRKLISPPEKASMALSAKFSEEDVRYRKYKESSDYAPHLTLQNPERTVEALVRAYRMPTTLMTTPVSEPAAAGYRPEKRF